MQPITLRATEPVKRIAIEEVQPLLPEDWPHTKVLNVTAALYGYEHWSHLSARVQAGAEPFVFDQDLSPDALALRRVELARNVEQRCQIPFPYAFELVLKASVSHDFRRPRAARQEKDVDAYRLSLLEEDLWQIVSTEYQHPLVPVGFVLGHATHVGDMAREKTARGPEYALSDPPSEVRWIYTLMPEDAREHPFHRISHLLYLRRDQLLEVETPVYAEMVRTSFRLLKRHLDQIQVDESLDFDDWQLRIKEARVQYARLAEAAGLSATKTRAGTESLDIRARDAVGEPWYWPLKLRQDPLGMLAAEFERIARLKWRDSPR